MWELHRLKCVLNSISRRRKARVTQANTSLAAALKYRNACYSISNFRRSSIYLRSCWDLLDGRKLRSVYLDYYHMPQAYVDAVIAEGFFSKYLLGLKAQGFFAIGADVWLPNFRSLKSAIILNWDVLTLHFSILFCSDASISVLWWERQRRLNVV